MGSHLDRKERAPLYGLASLRIGVCLALILEDSTAAAVIASETPRSLLIYPELIGSWLPLPLALSTQLVWIFRALSLTALVGYKTRLSLLGLVLLGAPLLGSAQLVAPVVHNMHLFWFLLLLMTAPCAATWSLDALLAKEHVKPEPRDRNALFFARLLLALCYFFPGLWKLLGAPGVWASSSFLVPLFHSKWYEFDFIPLLRVDQYPLLLQALGWGVVLLEVGFPFLILHRRLRWIALIGGLSFHLGSAQLLGIRFMPLWLCYGTLVDWPRVLDWLHDQRRDVPSSENPKRTKWWTKLDLPRPTLSPTTFVGSLLVAGVVLFGGRGQTQAWPFACYPTFHHPVGHFLPDIELLIQRGSDRQIYPSPQQARRRPQAAWGQAWDLLGYYGHPPSKERLRAYVTSNLNLSKEHSGTLKVDVFAVQRSTVPEQWDEAPRRKRHLGTITMAP